MFRRSTKGSVIQKSAGSVDDPALFDKIYRLAADELRHPDSTDWLLNANSTIDIRKNGTTPITMLACEGNHAAVEFLLNCGSDPKHAISGYAAAGYLLNREKARHLFAHFKSDECRQNLAIEAQKIVLFNALGLVAPDVKFEI